MSKQCYSEDDSTQLQTSVEVEVNRNLLKYLLEKANIKNVDEVLNDTRFMTKNQILKQHPYKITTNKDGRVSTYVLEDTSKRRKLIKPTEEQLIEALVKFYRERESKKEEKKLCLKDFYPEWLNYKALHTNSSAYIKTIDELWKRYYVNDKIVTVPLTNLTKYMLDTWVHTLVKEHNMTKKQYYNMAIIMRQALELAVEKNIISSNPYSQVKVDNKLFRAVKKKPDETQVYLVDEQPLVEKQAYKDFEATGVSASLAIPFAFQTGLRISELSALKWSDIGEEEENYIHIQRMEIREFEMLSDGSWSKEKYVIVDRAKSVVGNRNVYLTSVARDILDKAKECNMQNGNADSEYVFQTQKGRATARNINTILRRCCSLANISEKSSHKIRKTYISTLIDCENININYIREQVGHVDERTTYNNYCFNRKSKDQTAIDMENALVHS